jgi:DNA-binding transcriptional LysR family regulator
MGHMDVHRLELLRELAERGSVTAVARATNRTVSAVSQQLKVLEREAGVPLTERSGRGIVLTGAGRMLAQTATDVAVAIERAEAVWADFIEAPRGEVTLTTFPTGGQMLLPGLLDAVAQIPGLTLVATDQDPLLPDFADLTPDFDIVLADSPGMLPSWRERGLTVVKLLDEPLDVALPEGHPLAAKSSLSARDLVDETWIGVPLGFPYDRIVRQLEAITGVPATIGQRFLDNGIVDPAPIHDPEPRERARRAAARRHPVEPPDLGPDASGSGRATLREARRAGAAHRGGQGRRGAHGVTPAARRRRARPTRTPCSAGLSRRR